MTKKPNILLIIADDMNWDAVGAYGCPTPDTTPNIDRLASEGVRFNFGHVTIAVCQPSRSAIMTGLYPHNSGGEGFFNLRHQNIPILPELLQEVGYQVGILGKVHHSTPYSDYKWDMEYDMGDLGMGRNPDVYKKYASEFIKESVKSEKPFFLMANSHDPHRPFYGNDPAEWYTDKTKPAASVPSKTFTSDEITVPGFLEELPEVRLEIAEYYNSVRRCDDTVGELLDELKQQGLEDNTIVIFLSDNGMAFPFAKTNCYLNSTKTPWIMRWPKVIKQNSVDNEHLISGIDMLPTLLEAAGVNYSKKIDGTSFLPILKGKKQNNREYVFTQFSQTAGRNNYPMRGIQGKRFGYIYNPWSDGVKKFANESQAGRTFNAMEEAAKNDPEIMDRVNMFLYRVPEELYDFEKDPNALVNLIDNPKYLDTLNDLRAKMEKYMQESNDPILEAFQNRNNKNFLDKYLKELTNTIGGK